MSSAFFRRPTDGSSSSSEDDESEAAERGHHEAEDPIEGEQEAATTESFSSHGSASLGEVKNTQAPGLASVNDLRDNLLSALLEDFARNKACDLMNTASPGAKFNKSSAEIQSLAGELYQQLSQSFALSGLIPSSATSNSPASQQKRATYLAGIESVALRALQSREVLPAHTRSQLPPVDQHLAVARIGSQEKSPFSRPLPQSVTSVSVHQPSTHFSSPYSHLLLSARTPRRSHYESSFQQLKLLGKGGFGRVYHTYNLFDKKEYAVKKIPLSPRLSQRYKESGHKELENVLREVQALAQLEHSNVVRYHATWIEEPREIPEVLYQPRKPSLTVQGRKLIADRPAGGPPLSKLSGYSRESEFGDGIAFGSDSVSNAPVKGVDKEVELARSVNNTESETTSARTSEIFTDGHARANTPQDAVMDDSVYVLHVQMSVYPMTLAQYLAPPSANARSAPSNPSRRHCFHLVPALQILLGIICGLQYIHAKGLVHRDIKPSNIFISSLSFATSGLVADGYHDVGSCVSCPDISPYFVNPRIGDFGLVAELARENGIGTSDRTANSKGVGTEYYRPPLWSDSKGKRKSQSLVDEKLDVFSLGVILVELLWCCSTSTERLHVLKDLQKGKVPVGLVEKIDAEGHEPGTGDLVKQCIMGMLERDPRQRWACPDVKGWVEKILKVRWTSKAGYHNRPEPENGIGEAMRKVRSLDEAEAELEATGLIQRESLDE